MAVTVTQYRKHRTLARPFRSGELAALAGKSIDDNPYRRDVARRDPTRGSWTEGYVRAWAAGHREGVREREMIDARDRRQAALASIEGGP